MRDLVVRCIAGVVITVAGITGGTSRADAQVPVQMLQGAGNRGPMFYAVTSSRAERVDARNVSVLRQTISIHLRDVTIPAALAAIGSRAGLRFVYNDALLPRDNMVSLQADEITVAAALTQVLLDVGVDVELAPGGLASIVRRSSSRSVQRTGTLVGRVTDARSGAGIVGVTVMIDGMQLSTVTDESGGYRITDIAAGNHTIVARRIGYAKVTRSVSITDGTTSTLDLRMEQSANPLDQVVVTGTVIETERKAIPTPITVITAADITAQHITRLDDLFHGEVPGMWARPRQSEDVSTGAGLYVRGSGNLATQQYGNTIKTYVDGVEMSNPQFITLLDPNSIERIEIIRGPQGSTVYGENALNGVMQIFTKKGKAGAHPHIEATLSAGTIVGPWTHVMESPAHPQGTVSQTDNSVALSGSTSSLSYRVSGHYRYEGPWIQSAEQRTWDGNAGIRFSSGPVTVDASARTGEMRYGASSIGFDTPEILLGNYTPVSVRVLQPANKATRSPFALGGTVTYQPFGSWQHVLTVGQDRIDANATSVPFMGLYGGLPADSLYTIQRDKTTRNSIAYNTTIQRSLSDRSKMSVTLGADHWQAEQDHIFASAPGPDGALATSSTLSLVRDHDTGYFTQLQLGFADALFLTGGLRAEANPNFGRNHRIDYSPRAGLSYVRELGALTVKTRASYGRSISPPALGQKVTQGDPSQGQITIANPDLRPTAQVGGDYGIEMYYGSGTTLSASYFDQTMRDLIVLVSLPPTQSGVFVFQNQNVGKVHNTGWELEGTAALPASLSLHAAYTLMNSHVTSLGPLYTPSGFWPYHIGEQLRGVPHSSGAATLTYSRARGSIAVTAEHTGQAQQIDYVGLYAGLYQRLNPPGPDFTHIAITPAYTQYHVRASYVLTPHASVFVQGDNVTNTRVPGYINYTRTTGRSVMAGIHLQ